MDKHKKRQIRYEDEGKQDNDISEEVEAINDDEQEAKIEDEVKVAVVVEAKDSFNENLLVIVENAGHKFPILGKTAKRLKYKIIKNYHG